MGNVIYYAAQTPTMSVSLCCTCFRASSDCAARTPAHIPCSAACVSAPLHPHKRHLLLPRYPLPASWLQPQPSTGLLHAYRPPFGPCSCRPGTLCAPQIVMGCVCSAASCRCMCCVTRQACSCHQGTLCAPHMLVCYMLYTELQLHACRPPFGPCSCRQGTLYACRVVFDWLCLLVLSDMLSLQLLSRYPGSTTHVDVMCHSGSPHKYIFRTSFLCRGHTQCLCRRWATRVLVVKDA
jgi:hypothetical protein